jgi:enoyl-CoA hydratase/carnithine racemase
MTIQTTREGGVLHVALDRPEALNAMNVALLAAEVDAASWCFAAAEADESIAAFRARHDST